MFLISDNVDGASVAPDTPKRALATISISALVENAASADVAANVTAPIIKRRLLPILSPRLPIVINEPATKNP